MNPLSSPAVSVAIPLASAVGGSVLAGFLACIPSLHIYNVLGLLLFGVYAGGFSGLPPLIVLPFFAAMITTWALLNSIPSILLSAPDESALFTVLPGQIYLLHGRAQEAVLLTVLGGVTGLAVLIAFAGTFATRFLPPVHAVLQPHYHWMIWVVIAFLLLSEWPRENPFGRQGGWTQWGIAWRSLAAGLLTFFLAGFLGFILMFRPPLPADTAFQNLVPAFVGLFALPALLLNIASRVEIPPQQSARTLGLRWPHLLQGVAAGVLGGGFAAFVPAITGGVGGLLAGHATAQHDEKVFLVSQGASKVIYYAGGFLLLFVPALNATRGGGAWLIRGLQLPSAAMDYPLVLGAMAIAGAIAFFLTVPLTQGMLRLMRRYSYRRISLAAFGLMLLLVLLMNGVRGLGVMAVATGIGLLPLLYGARRMNCLGIILLPVASNMSGFGPRIAQWLGLLV